MSSFIVTHFYNSRSILPNKFVIWITTCVLLGSGRERDDGESQTQGQGGPQPGLGPGARHPAGEARAAGARCSTLPQVWSGVRTHHHQTVSVNSMQPKYSGDVTLIF